MTKAARLIGILSLLALFAGPLPAQDQPPESPEAKAKRLQVLAGEVQKQLDRASSGDLVEQGNGLEALAAMGPALAEASVPDLPERVREIGLAATDRFVAVLAGEVLSFLDRDATVKWLDGKAFSGKAQTRTKVMALAMLSEIPTEEAGRLCSVASGEGTEETRVAALVALSKLRLPSTYGAMVGALGAQEKAVKDNAAIALGRLADARAVPTLLAHLEDADGDHPAFAAWALKEIGDPSAFPAVANNLKSENGEPGDAKARVIEGLATKEHVDLLRNILTKSRYTKYRYAAALALGRLAGGDLESQKVLLQGLMRDADERIRSACFFGLSRNASPELGPEILDGLNRTARGKGDDQQRSFRWLAMLAGDLKVAQAAPLLLALARQGRNELSWRTAAVNFWKCAAPDETRRMKDEFEALTDDRLIDRNAEIIGRSARKEEFEFLVRRLRHVREGSVAGLSLEHALEHQTGHFFGPWYGVWDRWFEKNPTFFEPRTYRIDRRKWQEDFSQKDREYRQTPETEQAVQLGLAWLARHQAHDGEIDPNKFFERCSHDPPCVKVGARHMLDPVGTTSLAALAFLGGGYSPERGKFKDEVRRLLTYLEARQTADGNYTSTDRFQGYNRPIAIYALSEAFNVTGSERYAAPVRRGADYLTEIQNELGGWHYQAASRETDTSVMSWVLLGMSVAHKSGFPVREVVFEGCDYILDLYSEPVGPEREDFIDIDPAYGYEVGKDFKAKYQTGYQSRVHENATTSFGLMARMFLGWRRSHPFCIGSANFILETCMEEIPKGGNFDKYVSRNRFPSYAWYYGTLAMHQMGGKFFREWNAVIKELLPGIQLKSGCDRGAWPVVNYDFVAGKVYSTAMGVLTLETYYRYKPFCEEGAPPEEDGPGNGGK